MSKKLPKATAQTLDDLRRPRTTTAAPPAKAKAKMDGKRASAASRPARKAGAKPAERAKPAAKASPQKTAAGASVPTDELRRARAGQIVERYTAYAAVGSIIPLPLVDTLSVVVLIVSMVKRLADLYGVPFNRDRARAAVAGLAGGVGQAGAGSAVTSALLRMTPGANLVGAAASSVVSALLTRTAGRAFVLHFETGGTALEFDSDALAAHFERSRTA